MRISVIGCGYLGATHAAGLAELGFDVLGIERDPAKLAVLSRGTAPFSEPGLDDLLARHVASGRLRFASSVAEAAAYATVHFVCVGTPQVRGGTAADVSAVEAVVTDLARHATRDYLVVGKSTVPVGTSDRLAALLTAHTPPGVQPDIAWNPEFLREGHAVLDTLHPDRLVLGVRTPAAELTLRHVYARTLSEGTPLHVTDTATAELAKTAANSFLATKISFVNALADLSERAGADVVALADILGDDPRIGRRFLDAGIGFGGGCLPKDIRAFATRADELGATGASRLLREVDAINHAARDRAVGHALALCDGSVAGLRVAVLGAAFKPLSDDVRDSPALAVANRLHELGGRVRVFDPEANVTGRSAAPSLRFCASVETALSGADLVLHLTEWPQFRELDPVAVARLVRVPRLLDGRNKLDAERWREAGWTVRGLGGGSAPVPVPVPTALGRALGKVLGRA